MDTVHYSNPERPSTSCQLAGESGAMKRKLFDGNEVDGQVKKSKNSEYQLSKGISDTLHGIVYQVKLLMLFAWRGLHQEYDFKIATEMSAAEKFDDLVFQRTKDGKEIYRVLQAKHVQQGDSKRVTVNDLLSEKDGNFSLQKYFISYLNIKKDPCFEGKEIDFIICTNIDLDDDLKNNSFSQIKLEDNFLQLDEKSGFYKLKLAQFPNLEELKSILKNCSQCYRLAKILAERVSQGNKITLRDPLFKSYAGVLCKKVINTEQKMFPMKEVKEKYATFHYEFLAGGSPKFRRQFFEAYPEEHKSEESFWNQMKITKFRVSKVFGDELVKDDLPDDVISDAEINSFLGALIFAVAQPNEENLGKIIQDEMCKYKDINLIDSELVASHFQIRMLNWMKAKKATWFTKDDVEFFFNEANQKISKLVLRDRTLVYEDKIKAFGIEFEKDSTELRNLLTSKYYQIVNLISSHNTLLASIKVYQTIKEIGDSYIFMSLNSVSRLQDRVINAFKADETNLLIIECKSVVETIEELCIQLSRIVQCNNKKKVVFITQKNSALTEKCKDWLREGDKYYEYIYKNCNLINLTFGSQTKLLKKGKVIFQGKEVTLRSLIDNESKNIVDSEVLHKLINNNGKIVVGSKVSQKSDLESPAHIIIMPEEIERKCFKDEAIKDDLFVISGNLGINEKKLFDMKQCVLLNSKGCDTNFETVCHANSHKTIHLIEFKENKFIRIRYYDPNFDTDRKFHRKAIDISKFKKYVTKLDIKNDIFFIYGLTKKDFVKNYKFDERVIGSSKDANDDPQSQIIIIGEEKEFSSLCKSPKLEPFNVHLLDSREKTKLFWKCSKGKTVELSKLIVSDGWLSLLDIVKDTQCTVIADLSGTGKSTTLTLFAESYKEEKVDSWIIKVNLRDYTDEIDALPEKYNNPEDVVKFFSVIDEQGLKDTFAQKLFVDKLKKKDNILLLFDGFDEISSRQKEDIGQSDDKEMKIINLLKFLKVETEAKIVVTTRPYEKPKTSLENELSVLSYTFKPIENERQDFLKNFWKRSFKFKYSENEIKEDEYIRIAKDIIDKFDEIDEPTKTKFNGENKEKVRFLGSPLHLRMLAEIYLEKFNKSCMVKQDDYFQDLNTFYLYEKFMDKKYKIYFSDKTGISSTGVTNTDLRMLEEQYEKMHKRLAFKYLFYRSPEPFKLFFSESSFFENKMPNEEKTLELNRIGITQSRNKDCIDFIHRTFAEYFVSKLILDRLKQKLENPNYTQVSQNDMRKFLLNPIFINEGYNVIRSFINSALGHTSSSRTGAVGNLKKFWSDQIDPLEQKGQLLLAVREGLDNIFSFLLRSERNNEINIELISVPRIHIEELCDDGEYEKANLLQHNALKFLTRELKDDHLEVAFMKRYLGVAYGKIAENTENKQRRQEYFNESRMKLEEALSTFTKHLENEDDMHFQQALCTFQDDFESVKGQEKEKETRIRVLKIAIVKLNRNLANTYGDLKRYSEKEKCLKKCIDTLDNYLEDSIVKAQGKLFIDLKLEMGKAKRNLGNVYGEMADDINGDESRKENLFQLKRQYLEEAFKIFTEAEGEKSTKNIKILIAKTKRNLGNAYGKINNYVNDDKIRKLNYEKRRELIEDALPVLKEHFGFLDNEVKKAQKNLRNAYVQLGQFVYAAVIYGNENEVITKLNEYSNFDKKDVNFDKSLYLAIREGHPNIVKLLLDRGAKISPIHMKLAKDYLTLDSRIYGTIINIINSKPSNYFNS